MELVEVQFFVRITKELGILKAIDLDTVLGHLLASA
jgi:hypothetical protein